MSVSIQVAFGHYLGHSGDTRGPQLIGGKIKDMMSLENPDSGISKSQW